VLTIPVQILTVHPQWLQFSLKYYASWWNCNSATLQMSRTQLIEHGAWHRINTRKRTPLQPLLSPPTRKVKRDYSSFLSDKIPIASASGSRMVRAHSLLLLLYNGYLHVFANEPTFSLSAFTVSARAVHLLLLLISVPLIDVSTPS